MASRVRQEWQEILPGSGLGRTVPRSRRPGQGPRWRKWLVVAAKTSDANSGGGSGEGSLRLSTMGTDPSLSSWAIVLPEQAPAQAEARTCCLGTVGLYRAMPGWTPGFLGLLPVLGYPQGRPSSRVMCAASDQNHMPWVDRRPQWPEKVRAQGACHRNAGRKPTAGLSGHPALLGPEARFCLRIQAASWQQPQEASGRRLEQPHGPASSPVHRAPEGLE